MAECKICSGNSSAFVNGRILRKYDINYFQCESCKFIQTEDPYWLEESYTHAISAADTGIYYRNRMQNRIVFNVIRKLFGKKAITKRFLDYGGGAGLLVRMMRDRGLDFYRSDKYAVNAFARGFDESDLPTEQRQFALACSFELLEHLPNPMKEITNIMAKSDNFLASTLLYDGKSDFKGWWYRVPYSGQHIAFYSHETMKTIASELNLYYQTDGVNFHLFSKKKQLINLKRIVRNARLKIQIENKINPFPSLIKADQLSLISDKDHKGN